MCIVAFIPVFLSVALFLRSSMQLNYEATIRLKRLNIKAIYKRHSSTFANRASVQKTLNIYLYSVLSLSFLNF